MLRASGERVAEAESVPGAESQNPFQAESTSPRHSINSPEDCQWSRFLIRFGAFQKNALWNTP